MPSLTVGSKRRADEEESQSSRRPAKIPRLGRGVDVDAAPGTAAAAAAAALLTPPPETEGEQQQQQQQQQQGDKDIAAASIPQPRADEGEGRGIRTEGQERQEGEKGDEEDLEGDDFEDGINWAAVNEFTSTNPLATFMPPSRPSDAIDVPDYYFAWDESDSDSDSGDDSGDGAATLFTPPNSPASSSAPAPAPAPSGGSVLLQPPDWQPPVHWPLVVASPYREGRWVALYEDGRMVELD
ncbi:hypothetical protein PLICBS_001609 [Purpureocillium lilacinum]|uniref:uncharacterized protein n=1 Tax=Purpureocillium lilacinum TaxID=33203 RepID=UPI0020860F84|nr:hypothetical protein PLICBS_001609 [Purpureocillium lilacinum]